MSANRKAHRLPTLPLCVSFGAEVLVSLVVVAALMTLFIPYASVYLNKARLAQVFSVGTQLQTEMAIAHAVHGRWPDAPSGLLPELASDVRLERVIMTDGNFNLILSGMGAQGVEQNLSFRRAANPELGTVFWYCGFAEPDAIAGVAIPGITTVASEFLPPICKRKT